MKIGIIGMELSGKKTLFNILSAGGKNLVKRPSGESAEVRAIVKRRSGMELLLSPSPPGRGPG